MFKWLGLIVIWTARSSFPAAKWKTEIVLSWMLVRTVQVVILSVSLSYRPSQQDLEIIFVLGVNTQRVDCDKLSVWIITPFKPKSPWFSLLCHFCCLINERFANLSNLNVNFWIPSLEDPWFIRLGYHAHFCASYISWFWSCFRINGDYNH